MSEKAKGYIVTHTHWDREWRYPLWENRMYLVDFMDELLSILDNDANYQSFLLDGQTVAIMDYLQVRPENTEKVKKYIAEGRIEVGPWYTLPDLYPIDGESLIRNLLKGTRVAEGYGKCMKVAYESFGWGQTAQFPQIYKGFGLDFVVVAKNIDKSRTPNCEFLWASPDGTKVLATRLGTHARANFFMNAYLNITTGLDYNDSEQYRYRMGEGLSYHRADDNGFWNDHHKLEDTHDIHSECISDAVTRAWSAMDETAVPQDRLIMNGSDSTTAQPELTEIVRQANEEFDDKEFVLSSLGDYAKLIQEKIDTSKLVTVEGELRDGPAFKCSANALMTRPKNKILNKRAQNVLYKYAEGFSFMSGLCGAKREQNFLNIAENYLLLSHPHDSINGVTQDKTSEDVTYMLSQAVEIGEAVCDRACQEIVKKIDMTAFDKKDLIVTLFNALPFEREELLKLYVDIPRESGVWDFDVKDSAGAVLEKQFVSREEVTLPVSALHSRPWPFYVDRYCFYVKSGKIPAGGYKVLKIEPTKSYDRNVVFWPEMRKLTGKELSKCPGSMENEFLSVKVNEDGTVTVTDKQTGKVYARLNYFEDTGDIGDYWIYYPPYANKTFTSLGKQADIWTEQNGELSCTVGVRLVLNVPKHALKSEKTAGRSSRSEETVAMPIELYYTLEKGARELKVKLVVHNTAEDHRLRVLFDTGVKVKTADSAGHFIVDSRPITPVKDDKGEYYPEMQTLPMQYFVDLSDGKHGFGVIHDCFTEYEALDNTENTLAITLFRGVRNIICTEFRSAGVFEHEKGGQSLGELTYNYEISLHDGNWEQGELFQKAEKFNSPVKAAQVSKNEHGTLPLEKSFLQLEGAVVLSAIKKAEDRDSYVLRLFNPTKRAQPFAIHVGKVIEKAYCLDLNENREKEMAVDKEAVKGTAQPYKIITLELVL